MSDPNKPDDSDLNARLASLRSRIETKRPAAKEQAQADRKDGVNGVGQAFKLSSEFIAGIIVGGGLGYLVDSAFETTPWGMIILLLLGFCAGILNVLRSAGMVSESEMRLRPSQGVARKSDELDKKGDEKWD